MITSREELFQTIGNASKLGMLGLFIGTGFSKAVLSGSNRYTAYKWKELLETACKETGVDFKQIDSECSCPELATRICSKIATIKEISLDEAEKEFKKTVCELVQSYPEKEQREKYENWFKRISPSWITTTNYDTLIESTLGGVAIPISPKGCFQNVKGRIPVYHIHGIYNEPEEIIITNEDYAHLFRPFDYRQARLPFLIKESCVVMMGYKMGDVNVLTAVDWANNVYSNVVDTDNLPLIFLNRTDNPNPNPYIRKDNLIIYDITGIEEFMTELCAFLVDYDKEYQKYSEAVLQNIEYLCNMEESHIIEGFLNSPSNINILMENMKTLKPEFGYVYNSFFNFIREAIKILDKESREYGNFEPYNKKIGLILDILISIPVNKIPPAFFAMIASELDAVGAYVSTGDKKIPGKGYTASKTWGERKHEIPKEAVDELWRFSRSGKYVYCNLPFLLNSINTEDKSE